MDRDRSSDPALPVVYSIKEMGSVQLSCFDLNRGCAWPAWGWVLRTHQRLGSAWSRQPPGCHVPAETTWGTDQAGAGVRG